jgi:hypothetical protein
MGGVPMLVFLLLLVIFTAWLVVPRARIRRRGAPVQTDSSPSHFDLPLQIGEARESEIAPINPASSAPVQCQFTIGSIMIAIVAFALVFAIVPTGLAAAVVSALGGFFYVVFRHIARGDPLPPRVRQLSLSRGSKSRAGSAMKQAALKSTMDEF